MPENNDYFGTICMISRAFGTTLSEEELLGLIVQSAADTMQTKAAILFLFDEEQSEFVAVAQQGLSDHYVRSGLTQPQKIVPILLRDGYFYSRDATTDPLLNNHEAKRAEKIASVLVVPAMVKGKLHGGLCVFTSSPRDFSAKEIEFMTALAEQGGMAIQHARLIEQIRDNTRLFLDLSTNINSSLDIKKIFHILSADIAETFRVKASSILLVDEEKKTLELVASYGLSERYLNRGPLSAEKSVVESLEGKPVVIKDVASDQRVRFKKEKQEEGIVSILSVPIKSKEKVIGVLRLYSGARREFTEDEIMLVTALAYQGGLAIRNASMYLTVQSDMKDLQDDIWSHRSWF
jgi:GAF domain-containing protein